MKFIGQIILLVFLAILMMSFSFFRKKTYVDIAQEIRNKVGKELAKRHRMDVIAVGGGMRHCIREIALSFQTYRVLNQDEARCIIVDCVEELLKAFNENEAIRPYLSNYPFTTSNLDVAIFISTPKGGDVHYPDFYVVSIYNRDFITFRIEDQQGKDLTPITEPYQEALAKVKKLVACQLAK